MLFPARLKEIGQFFIWIWRQVLYSVVVLWCSVIVGLTTRGLELGLGTGDATLLATLAGITGTVIAIILAFVMFPLQNIAVKYSTAYLRFIYSDTRMIISFATMIVGLAYYLWFLHAGTNEIIDLAALIIFFGITLILWLLVGHFLRIADVKQGFVQPAKLRLIASMRHFMKKSEIAIRKQQRKFKLGEKHNLSKFSVHESVVNWAKAELLPFRQLASQAIKDGDYALAKSTLFAFAEIISNYLVLRRDYKSDQDDLLLFVHEEISALANIGSAEVYLRMDPELINALRYIGIHAAQVNVREDRSNKLNFLVQWPIYSLRRLCISRLSSMDSYAPSESVSAIGQIGVRLMEMGYDAQAANVVDNLTEISLLALSQNAYHVTGPANTWIVKILLSGIRHRNLGSQSASGYPYNGILKNINKILEQAFATQRTAFDNPTIGPFLSPVTDPFYQVNLSRITEFGLFEEGLTEASLHANLDVIKDIFSTLHKIRMLISKGQDQNWYFGGHLLGIVYNMLLHILAYLKPSIAKDLILWPHSTEYTPKLREKAQEVWLEGFKVILRSARDGKEGGWYLEDEPHHILISIYLILLYESRDNPELLPLLGGVTDELVGMLAKVREEWKAGDPDTATFKHFRLLKRVLKENKFSNLNSKFNVPEFSIALERGSALSGHWGPYPEGHLHLDLSSRRWILKRPGLQPNGLYYDWIEGELGLDKMSF